MLYLDQIKKDYQTGDSFVHALRGVTVGFRNCEFVSILGPSGCGKTTLLNIIGGLDGYTAGDLRINGISTKNYRDADWDAYRNHSVGFVFQSYNLIPHQSVLANVELALTLAGIPRAERRRRAADALRRVGLGEQLHKRPNQLSGGQMQRVAIARALVNDPDILLADEPTGALDSETSVQVMELLKEIASDRLVIMVTHNPQLAEQYSTRIIRLLDGTVVGDSMPLSSEETEAAKRPPEQQKKTRRTVMSFATAFSLSLRNLLTKKARTALVSFAGSIGIIGIALILSLSSGATLYIHRVEEDTLSSYPLQLQSADVNYGELLQSISDKGSGKSEHKDDAVYSSTIMLDFMNAMVSGITENDLASFKKYLESEEGNLDEFVTAIQYAYSTPLCIYSSDDNAEMLQLNPSNLMSELGLTPSGISSSAMSEMMGSGTDVFNELLDNRELLSSQYDVIAGRLPQSYDEVVFIVDKYNEINDFTLYALGLKPLSEAKEMLEKLVRGESVRTEITRFSYDELLSLTFRVLPYSARFEKDETAGVWMDKSSDTSYMKKALSEAETLRVVGVLRPSDNAVTVSAAGGIGYLPDLTRHMLEAVNESPVVKAQEASPGIDIFTGKPFASNAKNPEDYTEQDIRDYIATLPAEKAAEASAVFDQMLASAITEHARKQIITLFVNSAIGSSHATYEENLSLLGVADPDRPSSISIYPKDFESKDIITQRIAEYNASVGENQQIRYTDYVAVMMSSVTTIINAITYILIAFVAVSLVVSSIMIGIITYISVLERTKEIGVLRALGASKSDVSRVFNAETFIIGFSAGLLGIGVTLLLNIPINLVIHHFTAISGLSSLPAAGAVILIAISVVLTLIAGLIPSRLAAKKDPVVALRTE